MMSAHETKPLGGKIMTRSFMLLLFMGCLGAFFILKRFLFGLGSVTNMNDGYPWGIFIAYDVVVGTALACGGYSMALLVYIFNRGEFHPLLRPALLASLFGYTLAAISVVFDIGRYWQMYNLFLPGRAHLNSVLFEVALCIATYVMVLWVEFSPSVLEKIKAAGYLKTFNRIMFFFIALGVLLPTMHQSSLGTLLVIAGNKVSPLWHSPFLPILFLLSAISMGYAVVIFESAMSAFYFKRPLEKDILGKIGDFLPYLIIGYLVFRFGGLFWENKIGLVFTSGVKSLLFWLENAMYIGSAWLLWSQRGRSNPKMLFIAACVLLCAGTFYRFNAYMIGYEPATPGWHYFPSFSELSITLGLISIEVMGYIVLVNKLPILPKLNQS